jgi:hypothetical protein
MTDGSPISPPSDTKPTPTTQPNLEARNGEEFALPGSALPGHSMQMHIYVLEAVGTAFLISDVGLGYTIVQRVIELIPRRSSYARL